MSYYVRGEYQIGIGESADFESKLEKLSPLFAVARGSGEGVLAASLGYPGRYLSMNRWMSFSTFRDFVLGDRWRSFQGEGSVAPLMSLTRPLEAYVMLLELGAFDTADYLNVTEMVVKSEAVAEFVESRKVLFERLLEDDQSFTRCRLFQSLADPYQLLSIYEKRGEVRQAKPNPTVMEFFAEHPDFEYSNEPVIRSTFKVVRRL